MRIVGKKNRSEIELDPLKAFRRARRLDGMIRSMLPPLPRGITRGSHEYFNRIDDARMI